MNRSPKATGALTKARTGNPGASASRKTANIKEDEPDSGWENPVETERKLKELWAGTTFEEQLEISCTLDYFHCKLLGCKWDGIDVDWLWNYLIAELGYTLRALADKTIGELAALLRSGKSETKAAPTRINKNEKRDKLMHDLRKAGKELKEIQSQVMAEGLGKIGIMGIFDAIDRYCDRQNPPLPRIRSK